jgi:hypothetical protein
VITATGWTWEYIDEYLTLPRLNALWEHWSSKPPVHVTAALFAGIKPATPAVPRALDDGAKLDNAAIVRNMHTDPRTLKWQSQPNG